VDTLRDRIAELEEENRQLRALVRSETTPVPTEWRLTRTEAAIARLMIANPVVRLERVVQAVWGEKPQGAPLTVANNVSVYLWRIKRKVPEFQALRSHYGQGWELPERVRQDLLARMN
jgi:hypothetical protein